MPKKLVCDFDDIDALRAYLAVCTPFQREQAYNNAQIYIFETCRSHTPLPAKLQHHLTAVSNLMKR